jgi:hypothetical protein
MTNRDLSGRVFGRLTVLGRVDDERNGAARWHCLCECGRTPDVRGANLTSGAVLSCGCLRSELSRARAVLRNTTGPRDCTGRLSRTGTVTPCSSCKRTQLVLGQRNDEWLCRWCANRRSIAELMGKREPDAG